MNALRIAIALGFLAAPAFAQMIDLPRLTWPTSTPTTTQGCADQTSIGAAVHCGGK
ncbi:hypothetical protein ACEN2J_15555 [Pseudorhodobacter sp. W20_MBD10_FR17]|uniref:hypothetical protein n=1 Tax=Pseudorhodobacter sp. W20_MBD10_FR17 TaxID=3240266 RepID=UPI003F9AA983